MLEKLNSFDFNTLSRLLMYTFLETIFFCIPISLSHNVQSWYSIHIKSLNSFITIDFENISFSQGLRHVTKNKKHFIIKKSKRAV